MSRTRGCLRSSIVVLVLVLASLAADAVHATTSVMMAGSSDGFALPADPVSPSSVLASYFNLQAYDLAPGVNSGAPDRLAAHTFRFPGKSLAHAYLTFRVRAGLDPSVNTDGLFFDFKTTTLGAISDSIVYRRTFAPFPGGGSIFRDPDPGLTAGWPAGKDTTFFLDLSSLPMRDGSRFDLIPAMNAHGFLDFVVGDETAVDFAQLLLVEEADPATPLALEAGFSAGLGVPPTASCPVWTQVNSSPTPPLLTSDRLVLNTTAPAQNTYFVQTEPAIALPARWVIEFGVRYVSGSSNSTARAPVTVVFTTAPNVGNILCIGLDDLFLNSGPNTRGPAASLDTDGSLHDYRVEIQGSTIHVYQDGQLRLAGSTYSNPGDFGSLRRILWGEGSSGATGTSEWTYFRHNAQSSIAGCNGCTFACSPATGLALGTSYIASAGLTPDAACPPWAVLLQGAATTPSLIGDRIVIMTNSATDNVRFEQAEPVLVLPPVLAIEARVRLVSGSSLTPTRAPANVQWVTGLNYGGSLQIGQDEFFLLSGESRKGPSVFLDTDDTPHDYRIEVAGSEVKVFYDGALVLTGWNYSSVTDMGPTRRIAWGEGSLAASGTIEWWSFAHNGTSVACDAAVPVVHAPEDTTFACAAEVPSPAPEQATATDDIGVVSLTVVESSNGGSGSPTDPLVLTRTWTAADAAGHSSSDEQRITVVDSSPPTLSPPPDLVITAGPGPEPCESVLVPVPVGQATATDNCGASLVSASGLPAGGLFPVGETLVTWTAVDAVGNVSTATQRVAVSCPLGDLSGIVTAVCGGSSQAAAGVTVELLSEGATFRSTTTDDTGAYAFRDLRLGTYTLSVHAPEGYALSPDTRVLTLTATATADPFVLTCLLAGISGRVEGACGGSTSGLMGVTVDLYTVDAAGSDVLVATGATDASGGYRFDELALGSYSIGIVTPLGYSAPFAQQAVTLAVADASVDAAPFSLACRNIPSQPRAAGYWKHQVNVYLTGKGRAQESLERLLQYLDLLVEHFNHNLVNPVVVYVPGAEGSYDRLLQLQQLLTVNKGGTPAAQARQHLLALLLNVVSERLSQTAVISADGATVSQAITYSHDLLTDDIPSNDNLARVVCEGVCDGVILPAGSVPVATRVVTYQHAPASGDAPLALALAPVIPNPARGELSFACSIPVGEAGSVEVVDLFGRRLWSEALTPGGPSARTVTLRLPAQVRPGLYMVRLRQGDRSVVRRFSVIR